MATTNDGGNATENPASHDSIGRSQAALMSAAVPASPAMYNADSMVPTQQSMDSTNVATLNAQLAHVIFRCSQPSTSTSSNTPDATAGKLASLHSSASDNLWLNMQKQQQQGPATEASTPIFAPTMEQVQLHYAPVGLEKTFCSLYQAVQPCLVGSGDDVDSSWRRPNAGALLQGRAGKTTVWHAVRRACRHQALALRQHRRQSGDMEATSAAREFAPFRVVTVNGLLTAGHQVGQVVHEMLRQLVEENEDNDGYGSDAGDCHDASPNNLSGEQSNAIYDIDPTSLFNESSTASRRKRKGGPDVAANTGDASDSDDAAKTTNRRTQSAFDRHVRRLRRTHFTNHLQLLSELLQGAAVDRTPIVIVLDHLDAFVQRPTTLADMMAAGNAHGVLQTNMHNQQLLLYHLLDQLGQPNVALCFIGMTRHLQILQRLEKRVKSRLQGTCSTIVIGAIKWEDWQRSVLAMCAPCPPLQHEVQAILHHSPAASTAATSGDSNSDLSELRAHLVSVLRRQVALGRDLRWWRSVWTLTLAKYRVMALESGNKTSTVAGDLMFDVVSCCLLEALSTMGAEGVDLAPTRTNTITLSRHVADPRIQALFDLTGPQLAVLLSGARIWARDTTKEKANIVLTWQRMWHEYEQHFHHGRNGGGGGTYSRHLLERAVRDLLRQGLLQPAAAHNGTAIIDYFHKAVHWEGMPALQFATLPLHLTIDVRRELLPMLQPGNGQQVMLQCSTALREWGRKYQ